MVSLLHLNKWRWCIGLGIFPMTLGDLDTPLPSTNEIGICCSSLREKSNPLHPTRKQRTAKSASSALTDRTANAGSKREIGSTEMQAEELFDVNFEQIGEIAF
jgi:hypothetical protein